MRLSKEDKIRDESNSVTNQKAIIDLYIKNNKDLELVDFYIDDGYSGTTFDRPEYKRMIADIVSDKINTIIVKDLSRFGRNHIEADDYLENILPGYNVRFISINDNIDSFKNPKSTNSIEIPLRNLMNDQYARDISEKVKQALKMKQLNGEFIGVTAPYGYLKSPKDKHKFIIDKEASYNVKKIFNMILLGKSRKEIAEHLNDRNVLTPSMYKLNKEKTGNEKLVNRILRNETYTGTLIQDIKTKPSYRSDKIIDVSKDKWIKTKNHHEPIISKEKFDEVQKILDKKLGYFKNVDLLLRYLKCADCGKSLTIKKSKRHEYYYCSSYVRNSFCTNHSIKKDKLIKEVIKVLNNKYSDEKILNLNEKVIDKYINKITINEDKKIDIEFKD